MAAVGGDHGSVVEWWLLLVTLGCWWRPVLEGVDGSVVVGRAKVFLMFWAWLYWCRLVPMGVFLVGNLPISDLGLRFLGIGLFLIKDMMPSNPCSFSL